MRRFFFRLFSFFRSSRADRELEREIAAHLRLLEDAYLAQGMSRSAAREAARRAFGGQVEQTKLRQRDARGFRLVDESWLDLKLGARMLVKFPGLTIIAVAALSVAIGAGAAYREFVHDLIGSTLPGAEGKRVVGVQLWDVAANRPQHRSLADFASWRGRLRTIEHLGAHRQIDRNLITDDGRSEPLPGVEISASAFRLLRVQPLLGRPLVDDDERVGAPDVVVIGESLWHARFGSDPSIVGRVVRLGDRAHTVVGVMPASFGFPVNHSLWVPLHVDEPTATRGSGPEIRIFGRLAPDASLDAAQAEVAATLAGSEANRTGSTPALQAQVLSYVDSVWAAQGDNGRLQRMVLNGLNLLFIALLGICGANVATLVFGRTLMREGEITVRTALGASRTRIVLQLFAEALLLAVLAVGVGLTWAAWAMRWGQSTFLSAAGDGSAMPFWWDDGLSAGTYAYAGLLALLAAVLVGVIPALKATSPRMQSRLKHGTGGAGVQFGRMSTAVIVGQVAVTVLCLTSIVAVAWAFSMNQYSGGEVAFNRSQFVAMRLAVEEARAADLAKLAAEFEERLSAESGVIAITRATSLPGMNRAAVEVEYDNPGAPASDTQLLARPVAVAPNFFDTFGVPMVAGRPFTDADAAQGQRVAIVDEAFVRFVLEGRNAIGVRVREKQNGDHPTVDRWIEIVGVVRDVATKRNKGEDEGVLYVPLTGANMQRVRMALHAGGDVDGLRSRVRSIAASTDPALQVHDIMRLDQMNDADQLATSFFLKALVVVGGVLLLLSTAGIYSLFAFATTRRTREIGIRAAIGADQRQILIDIFARTFKQVGWGILLGSAPAAALVISEVAGDAGNVVAALVVVAVAMFVFSVAVLASVVPARRALRVQPTDALRVE